MKVLSSQARGHFVPMDESARPISSPRVACGGWTGVSVSLL